MLKKCSLHKREIKLQHGITLTRSFTENCGTNIIWSLDDLTYPGVELFRDNNIGKG